jgi:halimadienyl-diphosphate synthase
VTLHATGVSAAVRDLFDSMLHEPWGQTSPSVYETGRLVTLAPWLAGHDERVRWIRSEQRADGTWGGPDGYALVPTLSAIEALLSTQDGSGAVDRGLRAVTALMSNLGTVPDTPAADLLIPALVGHINERRGNGRPPVPLPAGIDGRRLAAVRRLLLSGAPVPDKLLHAAEAVADIVRAAPAGYPEPSGSVGASPAATAAWLTARPGAAGGALDYLETVVGRHGGPVPCAVPIPVFERSWVLSTLARTGVPYSAPPTMVRDLAAALGPDGTSAGAGLPADADTTSVALFALALLGEPTDIGSLWRYRVDAHFCTWPGENGVSVTTNAHVLDALGIHQAIQQAEAAGDMSTNLAIAVDRLAMWLCDHQISDGSWIDRWHASLYYATSCCVLALDRFGRTGQAARAVGPAVDRAVAWVLGTQRPDGSWGRWAGTTEETAYAMHVLLGTRRAREPQVVEAAARGHAYLVAAADEPGPALWHDKDLYRPAAIVRAYIIGALHLARSASI